MSVGNILKTIFFTVFVVGFFFIIWVKNPFVQEKEYPLPAKYRAMIYSDNPQIIAAGRQIVTQQCADQQLLSEDYRCKSWLCILLGADTLVLEQKDFLPI